MGPRIEVAAFPFAGLARPGFLVLRPSLDVPLPGPPIFDVSGGVSCCLLAVLQRAHDHIIHTIAPLLHAVVFDFGCVGCLSRVPCALFLFISQFEPTVQSKPVYGSSMPAYSKLMIASLYSWWPYAYQELQ